MSQKVDSNEKTDSKTENNKFFSQIDNRPK